MLSFLGHTTTPPLQGWNGLALLVYATRRHHYRSRGCTDGYTEPRAVIATSPPVERVKQTAPPPPPHPRSAFSSAVGVGRCRPIAQTRRCVSLPDWYRSEHRWGSPRHEGERAKTKNTRKRLLRTSLGCLLCLFLFFFFSSFFPGGISCSVRKHTAALGAGDLKVDGKIRVLPGLLALPEQCCENRSAAA